MPSGLHSHPVSTRNLCLSASYAGQQLRDNVAGAAGTARILAAACSAVLCVYFSEPQAPPTWNVLLYAYVHRNVGSPPGSKSQGHLIHACTPSACTPSALFWDWLRECGGPTIEAFRFRLPPMHVVSAHRCTRIRAVECIYCCTRTLMVQTCCLVSGL